jgi:hypothetical protein
MAAPSAAELRREFLLDPESAGGAENDLVRLPVAAYTTRGRSTAC